MKDLSVMILAAGQGTRMNSDLPKVLHPVLGRPMIKHVTHVAEQLHARETVVVIGEGMEAVETAVVPAKTVIQSPARGTGDAARIGFQGLESGKGTVLILYGDVPLLSQATCAALIHEQKKNAAAVAVLAFRSQTPSHYGRVITDGQGRVEKIVEFRDASEDERRINLCNSGIYAFDLERLEILLSELKNHNAQKEYYLTDCVHMARARGWDCRMIETLESEVLGVNTKQDLAVAEHVAQNQKRMAFLLQGVTMVDPNTVYFSHDTQIGRNVTLEPNIVFGENVKLHDNVEIKAFSHIESTEIMPGAVIGPFARIRTETVIGKGAQVGNFVEVKKSDIKDEAKIKHLSYIGDGEIGAYTNIGAGTIFCNYDGVNKHKTVIGENVMIGSNSTLVPPLTIHDGAYVAAATLVREDVPGEALVMNRRGLDITKGGAKGRTRAKPKTKKAS